MRELHADAMHIFHRSAERQGASDDLIDRDGDRRARGRSILTYGSQDLEGDELGLRPDAETDRPDAVSSQDREAGLSVGEDFRPRQRDVDIRSEERRVGKEGRSRWAG